MPSSILLRLIAVTLLSGCLAANARAADIVSTGEDPALARADADYAGAALPAHGPAVGAASQLDLPGMREFPSGSGHRAAQLGGCGHPLRVQSHEQRYYDMAAHLLRSGIHNSSLNIPPPRS